MVPQEPDSSHPPEALELEVLGEGDGVRIVLSHQDAALTTVLQQRRQA